MFVLEMLLILWKINFIILNCHSREEASEIVEFLKKCQNPDGGYGGGPSQYSHLAPTYAAVCALAIIGTKEAFDSIDRNSLSKFLWRMKTDEGAFMMHESGEIDIRGVYCAVSVARLTNIYTEDLFRNTSHWVLSCQTYEGGFSGSPGLEAHGGYTFCGLAALTLLRAQHMCNTESLLRWGVNRQMRFEGGFQGRTNKLVDGCYSFWQGGLFPIIHSILSLEGNNSLSAERWMFHQEALQEYLLICCQYSKGGLIDKPGKSPDLYHTCYTLSGLSIAQHFIVGNRHKKVIVGNPSNELRYYMFINTLHPYVGMILNKMGTIFSFAGSCTHFIQHRNPIFLKWHLTTDSFRKRVTQFFGLYKRTTSSFPRDFRVKYWFLIK
ncbi:Protein farnesyltransferase subunit beta [Armadillidium nasatum]|uniref:Protein farnesyltransferase subunit beta n=1 Tax=Armadillidium nasatum TaxID=96803 RepID=A0A5N5T3E7_9CRUS|nr:Protein farnesyltransferase subunit beta [Armadillidium nasatum]